MEWKRWKLFTFAIIACLIAEGSGFPQVSLLSRCRRCNQWRHQGQSTLPVTHSELSLSLKRDQNRIITTLCARSKREVSDWYDVGSGDKARDCLVLFPDERVPKAIIHFIGGFLAGSYVPLAYSYLCEELAANGFLIVATEIPTSEILDHGKIAKVASKSFANYYYNKLVPMLGSAASDVPVIGLSHSLGGKLTVLLNSDKGDRKLIPKRAANVYLSFNNYGIWDSITQSLDEAANIDTTSEGSLISPDLRKLIGRVTSLWGNDLKSLGDFFNKFRGDSSSSSSTSTTTANAASAGASTQHNDDINSSRARRKSSSSGNGSGERASAKYDEVVGGDSKSSRSVQRASANIDANANDANGSGSSTSSRGFSTGSIGDLLRETVLRDIEDRLDDLSELIPPGLVPPGLLDGLTAGEFSPPPSPSSSSEWGRLKEESSNDRRSRDVDSTNNPKTYGNGRERGREMSSKDAIKTISTGIKSVLRDVAGKVVENVDSAAERVRAQVADQVSALSGTEFSPSPEETWQRLLDGYNVQENYVFKFDRDTIDQSIDVARYLRQRGCTVRICTLPGTHLTPNIALLSERIESVSNQFERVRQQQPPKRRQQNAASGGAAADQRERDGGMRSQSYNDNENIADDEFLLPQREKERMAESMSNRRTQTDTTKTTLNPSEGLYFDRYAEVAGDTDFGKAIGSGSEAERARAKRILAEGEEEARVFVEELVALMNEISQKAWDESERKHFEQYALPPGE